MGYDDSLDVGIVDVESAYRVWSQSYDVDDNRTRDLDFTILRTYGLATADRDILELGCGTGKNTAGSRTPAEVSSHSISAKRCSRVRAIAS